MAIALLSFATAAASAPIYPVLAPIGVVEIVWNKTRDACPYTKFTHNRTVLCEEPDSMPIAWHNPLTNITSLISATDCTYPTIGQTLDHLIKHDCSRSPYVAINDSRPFTYKNHQWLQSAHVFANGSGFAFVHNEFHGEQPPHNKSYCSFDEKTDTGQCILWSTDLATTSNGGDKWNLVDAPLITLPRRYIKDAPIAGYGELGSALYENGMFYAHVSRSYHNNTGAGPPNTVGGGTCVFRTSNPFDPSTYRGWNGTSWSTSWVNPYKQSTPVDQLWQRTCQAVDLDGSKAAHINPKRFVGPLTSIEGWPTHAMTGLDGAKATYYYPSPIGAADGDAPFTSWKQGPTPFVDISDWMDPCLTQYNFMYPNLIDHSSPFNLRHTDTSGEGSDGLSYNLIGNSSLYLYAVLSREFIVRIPVAFFLPNQTLPKGPYKPNNVNPANCTQFRVTGAGIEGVNGVYTQEGSAQPDGTHKYILDSTHSLYHLDKIWRLADPAVKVYYAAMPVPGDGVPVTGWGNCLSSGNPTVTCMNMI